MAVRVGFVGVGNRAKRHIENFAGFEDVELVAFCDIDEQKAREVSDQYGGKVYTNYKQMYEKEDFDAVYVCLPPFAHQDQELDAVQKGLSLFVEKPIGLDFEKISQVNEVIKAKGIISSVGYQLRYLDVVDKMAELLKGRKVSLVVANRITKIFPPPWWTKMSESGGQIVEQATHNVDLSRYLVGEVERVYGVASIGSVKDIPDFDIHDASTVSFVFEDGAVGVLNTACIARQSIRAGVTVYTRDLTLDFNMRKRGLIVYRPDGKETTEIQNEPTERMNRAFIEAVKFKDPSRIRSSYSDAAKTLKITLAANESIKKGQPVKLDLKGM